MIFANRPRAPLAEVGAEFLLQVIAERSPVLLRTTLLFSAVGHARVSNPTVPSIVKCQSRRGLCVVVGISGVAVEDLGV